MKGWLLNRVSCLRIDTGPRRRAIGGTMNRDEDFEVAVGEAAQDAVWGTEHPLTHHLAEADPRRAKYLREYQRSVGNQVLAAIEALRPSGYQKFR